MIKRRRSSTRPPRWSEAFLRMSLRPGIRREDIVGGMSQEFFERSATEGLRNARTWYRGQVVGLVARALWTRIATPAESPRGGWEMASVGQDVRFAVRMIRKNPLFSLVAVFTLALGIGANIAIYTVVDAVLLEPLPFEEPEELTVLWLANEELGQERALVAPREFDDWRSMNATFEGLAGFWPSTGTIREEEGLSTRVRLVYTTENFFEMLGAETLLGRGFTPEDGPGSEPVLLLSEGFWKSRFGSDPSVVGQAITLDGGADQSGPIEVVGIVRGDHTFPADADVWVNMTWPMTIQGRGPGWMSVLGRLGDGQDLDAARGDMISVAARLAQEHPETNRGWTVGMASLHEEVVGDTKTALLVLLGATALILLIACANVANLLLSRAEVRAREIAVRIAFGAGRARLARQLVTESLVLAGVGAVVGLVFAQFGVRVLLSLVPEALPRAESVAVDGRVLAMAVGVALVTGVLFGLAPVVRLLRSNVHDAIRDGNRSVAGARKNLVQHGLVVSQFGMALMLVVGANLLLNTLENVRQVDPGFVPGGVLTVELDVPRAAASTNQEVIDFYERYRRRLGELPGVVSVGDASTLPLGEALDYTRDVVFVDREIPTGGSPIVHFRSVSPGFFEALRAPVVAGRTFTAMDRADAPGAVVINQAFADRFFPGEDPLGERIGDVRQCFGPLGCVHDAAAISESEIVGVVRDMKYDGLRSTTEPALYFSGLQSSIRRRTIVLQTTGGVQALIPAVRQSLSEMNRSLALTNVQSMGDLLTAATARERFSALLLSLFGLVALILASVGVYGVLAYAVAQRTEELGIRMALGADRSDLRSMVLGDGMKLVLIGLAFGVFGAAALSGLLATQLFGVDPRDPLVYLPPVLVLLAVGLVASFVPAWRATEVDPAVAMHAD